MPGSSSKAAQLHNDKDIPSCYSDTHGIITTTTNDVPSHRVLKNLGTIYGLTVRSRNWGADIAGALRSSIGGELKVFTNLMYTARNQAMDRMLGECMGRGGNAILGVRFDIVAEGPWSQVCAYGTAVLVEEVKEEEGDVERVAGR